MFSKPVAVGVLLVLACITGAAGGAYFAGRQSTPEASAEAASVPPAPAPASAAQDTEAVITPSATTGSAPAPGGRVADGAGVSRPGNRAREGDPCCPGQAAAV